MSRLALFLSTCVAIAASGQQPDTVVPIRNSTTFVSRKHGFSVDVPVGWHVATGKSDDLPLLVNFAWSSLQAQGVLPKGGASIHILAEADLPEHHRAYSLDEWAEFDKRVAAPETVTSRVFEMPQSSRVGQARMVSFDEATGGSPEQQQHDVTVYWQFRGERFATHLFYVVGDPNSKWHETHLVNLMRSLRPLSAASGRRPR